VVICETEQPYLFADWCKCIQRPQALWDEREVDRSPDQVGVDVANDRRVAARVVVVCKPLVRGDAGTPLFYVRNIVDGEDCSPICKDDRVVFELRDHLDCAPMRYLRCPHGIGVCREFSSIQEGDPPGQHRVTYYRERRPEHGQQQDGPDQLGTTRRPRPGSYSPCRESQIR
jgi:hypothetical protein